MFPFTRVNAPSMPPPRAYHSLTLVAHDTKMVLFGGFDGSTRLNDLHVFDLQSETWETPSDDRACRPSPRTYHSATLHGNLLFIFGGFGGNDKYPKHLADLHILDTSTWQWTSSLGGESFSGSARYFHSATLVDFNKLFVFGVSSVGSQPPQS